MLLMVVQRVVHLEFLHAGYALLGQVLSHCTLDRSGSLGLLVVDL